MTLTLLEVVVGFACLLGGADLVVRAGLALAKRWRVPAVIVGLTVVSLASTAPELGVVTRAALVGHTELAVASVVGCTIANLFLILGITALFDPPACLDPRVRWMGPGLLAVCLGVLSLFLAGPIGPIDGLLLLTAAGAVLGAAVASQRFRGPASRRRLPLDPFPLGLPERLPTIVLMLGLGAAMLPLGAGIAVEAVMQLATTVGVPEAVLGLSLVGLGASLPEVATAVVAIRQRKHAVAVGNIIGSSVLNLLLVLGLGAVFSPQRFSVSPSFLRENVVLMVIGAAILAGHTVMRVPVGRLVGSGLLVTYLVYFVRQFATV